jgi:hypothetical protein
MDIGSQMMMKLQLMLMQVAFFFFAAVNKVCQD